MTSKNGSWLRIALFLDLHPDLINGCKIKSGWRPGNKTRLRNYLHVMKQRSMGK